MKVIETRLEAIQSRETLVSEYSHGWTGKTPVPTGYQERHPQPEIEDVDFLYWLAALRESMDEIRLPYDDEGIVSIFVPILNHTLVEEVNDIKEISVKLIQDERITELLAEVANVTPT